MRKKKKGRKKEIYIYIIFPGSVGVIGWKEEKICEKKKERKKYILVFSGSVGVIGWKEEKLCAKKKEEK